MVLNAGVLVNYVRSGKNSYLWTMQRIKLSIDEKKRFAVFNASTVGTPDYVRLTCILMFDNGRSSKSISEDLGISIATVYRYVGDYQSGGIDNLLESHCQGYWGKLDSMQLCAKILREHIYTDAKSVSERIRVTFGVSYTPQGTVDLLNRIGFTYKKTTEVPCEADAFKQAEFVKELSGILSSTMLTGCIRRITAAPHTHG